MAEELFTFSEDGMRKLADLVRSHQRETKRRLSQTSVRRHQTVYMPGSSSKIVRPSTIIHAAWGGPSNLYDRTTSGGDVETYGNYVHGTTNVQRKMYAGTCNVYEYDSSHNLADTTEEISVYNPGALPCYSRGTYLATPFGGDYLITSGLDQFTHHRENYTFTHYGGGAQTLQFGKTEFLDQTVITKSTGTFSSTSANLYDLSLQYDYSGVMIRLPGAYKVTFGIEVTGAGAQTYTSTDSASNTTTVNRHTRFQLFLWKNFNPDAGNLVTQGAANAEAGIWGTLPMDTSTSHQMSIEKTVQIVGTLADWHGGPYTRLNLGLRVVDMSGAPASNALTWQRAWLVVEPMSDGRIAGLYDGVGMNPYLGSSGTYQWYGGGPSPGGFDKDGVWL
jgi:hypothetical protein